MLTLIILTSLLPGILAVVQYFNNEKKERENSKNEKVLNSKIDSLKIDNDDLNRQLKNLVDDNINLSHQLSETALELSNNVIGASDLDIQINNTKNSEFNFRFENDSDLPIVNAHITIQNYNEIKKCEIIRENENQVHIKADCYESHFIKRTGINLNPHAAIIFNDKNFNFLKEYMNFSIQIETRRKTIIYHLVYKLVNDKMVKSYRLYNLTKGRKIFVSEFNPLELTTSYWTNNFYEKVLFTD